MNPESVTYRILHQNRAAGGIRTQSDPSTFILQPSTFLNPFPGFRKSPVLLALLATPFLSGAPLETAGAVRDLPAAEAAKGREVSLRGVITHSDSALGSYFLDASGGLKLLTHTLNPPRVLNPGDVVEVRGVTDAAGFLNSVGERAGSPLVLNLLEAGKLPEPVPFTGADIARPGSDGSWVSIEAKIREVLVVEGFVTLQCQADPAEFFATLNLGRSGGKIPWELAGRRARLRGVVSTAFNDERQMTLRLLRVSTPADIETISEGDPSSLVAKPTRADLLLRADGPGPADLVSLRGVTTHVLPGRGLFLRADKGSLWVQTAQPIAALPGTVLLVEGWPRPGDMKPFLNARRIFFEGAAAPPDPVTLSVAQAREAQSDAELVSVQADLLDILPGTDGLTLEMRDDATVFRGFLPAGNTAQQKLAPGMRLRLTGIAQISSTSRFTPLRQPDKLLIQLRSPEDIAILAMPSLWTRQNMIVGSSALLGLVLIITVVAWSRRKVERQTQRREFEAVLAERARFAREIHDSLAQGLTSISLQLECVKRELASDTGHASEHLEVARGLVRESIQEARRSVWNLRPLALGENDLVGALQKLGAKLGHGSQTFFSLLVEGTPEPLPGEHQTALLRIGQEAVSNALRHAAAKNITLTLRFEPGWVSLTIRDDGKGFDLANITPSKNGGFGLPGMRERVDALGGSLTLDTQPGEGTEVTATLPLAHS